jgi:Protein of unknown function (DUF4232)
MTGYGGAAGTMYTDVRVTNASRGTCYLQGTPGAQVLDGKARLVVDGTKAVGAVPGTPSVEGGDPVAVLPPGGSTDLSIGWVDWCGPAIAGPFSFAIVLPAEGGRLVSTWGPGVQPMATPVACMGGASSEVFSNGPFQPQAGSVTPTPEATPLPPQVTFGNLPTGSIPLGATIHYTVTLTNVSGAPLDLRAFADGSSCPTYEELLAQASPTTPLAFTLNCSSLGLIAPGASVTFAMQMPTTGLRAGSYTLFWVLAPDRLGPSGKVSVTIG